MEADGRNWWGSHWSLLCIFGKASENLLSLTPAAPCCLPIVRCSFLFRCSVNYAPFKHLLCSPKLSHPCAAVSLTPLVPCPVSHPTEISPKPNSFHTSIHHCATKCLWEPRAAAGATKRQLALCPAGNTNELLIVLCASPCNALFIFNHRTNTRRHQENMARHLYDDMCKQLAH